jgi:Zn-dependent protease with chaperone function
MFKAVFSVRNARPDNLHEITAEEQPRLFAFLFKLADAAGAPRPHKVYLSHEVNAAVFYDLTLFNLIFPSKKNLLIGLPLVNALNLGELRAVLAHEFGHFAQRSMAVGRWVYTAQQIAAHLVARRDQLEDFLDGLARIDLRVRAVVLVVQVVIWAIRSVIDSAFRVVVLMQRALSREMEMQADLVAVSLTGSDALIHALHRLQAADDAWNRSLQFIFGERHDKRRIPDAYAIQSHVTERMGRILTEQYAKIPPVPADAPDAHRLFKPEMAQPPRMWLTHPLNHEREANAKRHYVPAPIDANSAWVLFDDAAKLRADMTTDLLGPAEEAAQPVDLETSLKALAQIYRREQYSPRYHGVYFGRSLTRHVDHPGSLRNPEPGAMGDGSSLYPASLQQDVSQLRKLETQAEQLKAIIAGAMKVEGGTVHLDGESLGKAQLPSTLARLQDEISALVKRLQEHDYLCRSWHRGAALKVGQGWPEYLDGALALIHYCEHQEAELADMHGLMHNTIAVATASGRLNDSRTADIVLAANHVHHVLEQIFKAAPAVQPDERMRARPELADGWTKLLGEFDLPLASRENIGDWLNVIDNWVGHVGQSLSMLRGIALEQLLLAEFEVVKAARLGEVAPAPSPSAVPATYTRLLAGEERERVSSIGWWARFLRADGALAEWARLAAAGVIVALVIAAGTTSYMAAGAAVAAGDEVADNAGRASGGITAFNGLGASVIVDIDGENKTIPAQGSAWFDVPAGQHKIVARTLDGREIETFESSTKQSKAHIYNVAAAAPLFVWTASYGRDPGIKPEQYGAVRWKEVRADYVFSPPPERMKGNVTRRVADNGDVRGIEALMRSVSNDEQRKHMAIQHARFDDADSRDMDSWMAVAMASGSNALAERLAAEPRRVQWLRAEQSIAEGTSAKEEICKRHRKLAAAAPDDPDMQYIGMRCANDAAEGAVMIQAHKRWPEHPWIANGAAWEHVIQGRYADAVPIMEKVLQGPAVLASANASRLARVKRVLGHPYDKAALEKLAPELERLHALDTGYGNQDSPGRSYSALAGGRLALAFNASDSEAGLREHVLRLAAASDGASRATVERALKLAPDQGMDMAAAYAMWGLALREKQDATPYHDLIAKGLSAQDLLRLDAFMAAVAKDPANPANASKLNGVEMEIRAWAYGAAIVRYGKQAPAAWRSVVRGLLFANERPYFAL